MFEKISIGWQLAKQSANVLRLDKELLMFPIFSGLACLLATASFIAPIYFTGMYEPFINVDVGDGGAQADQAAQAVGAVENVMLYVLMFLFYFVTYFIIIFFNSALVACAIIRLKGGDPTLADGFSAAMARLPQIAGWALVAATVGMILKVIESRSERVGQIVSGLLGMAWSVTTFFVIPILVVEKAGPVEAFKRSVAVMKKTWGEALTANWGTGFIMMLGFLVGLLPIFGAVAAFSAELVVVGSVLMAIGVIWMILVALVSSALETILLAALYIYAEEGVVPGGFDSQMIQRAFAHK